MSLRLRALPTALLLAAACSDGSGPREEAAAQLVVLRTQSSTQSLWRFDDATGRRLTGDTVRFILDVTRADDGRIAWLGIRPETDRRYTLIETTADGRVLRSVALGSMDVGFGTPREIQYSPDGRRLAWRSPAVSGGPTDSLYVLDAGSTTPRGHATRRSSEEVAEGILLAPPLRWTPGGRIVYGPPRSLIAFDPVMRDSLTLATNAGYIPDYDFTADGRLALVSRSLSSGGGRILTQRAVGGPLIQITGSAEANPWFVRWHPDGQLVGTTATDSVFAGGVWYGVRAPQVMSVDGSTPAVRIPGVHAYALHGWTPSRTLVATGVSTSTVPGGLRDVFLLTTAGASTNLTNTSAADETRVLVIW